MPYLRRKAVYSPDTLYSGGRQLTADDVRTAIEMVETNALSDDEELLILKCESFSEEHHRLGSVQLDIIFRVAIDDEEKSRMRALVTRLEESFYRQTGIELKLLKNDDTMADSMSTS